MNDNIILHVSISVNVSGRVVEDYGSHLIKFIKYSAFCAANDIKVLITMSVSSLEEFEQLLIYPIPQDNAELSKIACNQVKYFLRRRKRKKEVLKAKIEINQETNENWLRKHSGKTRVEELSRDEKRQFFTWFLDTVEKFKQKGVVNTRKMLRFLCNLSIFENRSQAIVFVNCLNFQKVKPFNLAEVDFALTGCGIQNVNSLRLFIRKLQRDNEAPEKGPLRHIKKKTIVKNVPRKIKMRSPSKQQMKNTTTRSILPGGGFMYTCSSDFPHDRPSTAPDSYSALETCTNHKPTFSEQPNRCNTSSDLPSLDKKIHAPRKALLSFDTEDEDDWLLPELESHRKSE